MLRVQVEEERVYGATDARSASSAAAVARFLDGAASVAAYLPAF